MVFRRDVKNDWILPFWEDLSQSYFRFSFKKDGSGFTDSVFISLGEVFLTDE